ncbi:28S ribosomal protein S6, mitochondrial [Ursus maritimus]|uniref:Small ribosomal subunit protein bS6m n=1 Tax=Ursus maritimus TaxID=29073 RepID=A0A384CZZ5_URSMA|nr:28S ribosomal protein S6, mitochondrial [Ursus maritimus]
MDRGAIVRNLENLGDRTLPYKISAHSRQHSRGGARLTVGGRLLDSSGDTETFLFCLPSLNSSSSGFRNGFSVAAFRMYFLVDFYAPATAVESIMEHLSRDTDVIRPNVVKHPLTQEVKKCEGIVPVPLEEKLYSTKKRK